MKKAWKPYLIGILIPVAVGGLSALLTAGNMDLYKEINKPPLAPPGLVFPIAWTVLYILMGIGSVLIYRSTAKGSAEKNGALLVYGLQLVVNFFWSILFFNVKAYLFSFLWLILLWILILCMIVKFMKIHRPAGLLQIPYLLWVTFAGYLNLAIYLLNR